MNGTLYLVPTPIGNLGDLSPRAVEILSSSDFIAAEDTRVTLRLLNHLGLRKHMVSYHEHNREKSGAQILSRLQSGETCALVTDAGTPAISDPGEALVALCAQNHVTVCAIPGPCAAITALAVSGLPTGQFVFIGFCGSSGKQRRETLASLSGEHRTMIFYEAPHRLRAALDDLRDAFGPDRKISLCRELTKLHEEILRVTLEEAVAHYAETEPRGEYVLVVAGKPPETAPSLSLQEACLLVESHCAEEQMSTKEAVKTVSLESGISRNALYQAVIARRNSNPHL